MSNSVSYSLDYHLFPPNTVFLRFRFTALTNQIPTFFSIFSVYSSSHPNITSIKVNNILCNHSVLMQTPVCSVRGLVAEMRKFTQTTKSCGRKGTARPLSQGESTLTLALAGFYCFSGHITLRMVLIYYAQFALGGYLLQKTKERMLLITSKREDICKCKGKSGWTG